MVGGGGVASTGQSRRFTSGWNADRIADMELTWMATRLSAYSLPLQPARLSTAGLQTSASCASPEQMLSLSLSSASRDFFFSSMQSLKLLVAASCCSSLHMEATLATSKQAASTVEGNCFILTVSLVLSTCVDI